MATARTAPTAMDLTATERTGPTATEPTAVDRLAFPALGRLVGASATGAFLETHFGRDAFRGRLADGEASSLFGWRQLNDAIAAHRLGPPRFKLEKAGHNVSRAVFRERRPSPDQTLHDLDVTALYAQLRDGATLIVDAVNELHPPLRALCSGLADEFCAHSQANLYACWGESQGFDVHWDAHDVFVVQIEGAKRWDLYGVTGAAPTRRDRVPAAAPTQAPEQIVLAPGDVLYLPRGYWHAAVGQGEPSLHLTIGLSRKTGADFLRWLADEARADAGVRADLQLEKDDAVLGDQVADLLRALSSSGDPAELGRRYRRHLEAASRCQPQMSLPHIGRTGDEIGPNSRLRLAEGARALQPGAEPQTLRLAHRGVYYTLAAATYPAISALIAGEAIPFADLLARCPQISHGALQAFVSDMLGRGVFVVAEPEG